MSRGWAATSSSRSSRARAGRSTSGSARSRDGSGRPRRSPPPQAASPAMPAATKPAVRKNPDIGRAGLRSPASSVRSCAPLLAEQSPAHPTGADIDDKDRQNDHQQDRADIGIIELADRGDQLHPDAAGADEAHHGRAAHIDLKAKQRVTGEAGHDLRQHPKAHAGDPACAGGTKPFNRVYIDILGHFGILLAERADRMDGNREYAGHRAETE